MEVVVEIDRPSYLPKVVVTTLFSKLLVDDVERIGNMETREIRRKKIEVS